MKKSRNSNEKKKSPVKKSAVNKPLLVNDYEPKEIEQFIHRYEYKTHYEPFLINSDISPCLFPVNKQSGRSTNTPVRVTVNGSRKGPYLYQCVYADAYGVGSLLHVYQIKGSKKGKTVSHLCGNGKCCNADHLIVEEKETNDIRTGHHHFLRVLADRDLTKYRKLYKEKVYMCGCFPPCGTIHRINDL